LSYKFKKQYRLKGYDYSKPGYYYVTICTKNRNQLFGEIRNQKMYLSEIGKICETNIHLISKIFPFTKIDTYVIMPNHIHVLIKLNNSRRNGQLIVPTQGFHLQPIPKSLSIIIRDYKG